MTQTQQQIVGWEGLCFIPGDGHKDEQGRQVIMTTHAEAKKETVEEAWQDALTLGKKYSSEFISIRPITENQHPTRPRRLITIAIYSTVEE